MDFQIRAMTAADVPAGLRLSTAVGWNQLEAEWRFLVDTPGNGGFVAERGDVVVGTVGYVRHGGLSWIAMMLVDPAERRAGIGRALMERVLHELCDDPCVGLDATPLGHPLYLSCGLVDEDEIVRTKAIVDASGFAGAAQPMHPADLDAVLSLDLKIFGADRSVLLRLSYGLHPEFAWVSHDGGRVAGYCFGRLGRLFDQVGPVCAESREAAMDVLASCLARMNGRVIGVDAPLRDEVWMQWLQSAGFTVERPLIRMFVKGHRRPGDRTRIFAIAGPAFG